MSYGIWFPHKSPGYVQGVATCTDTSDVSGCASCLEGLKGSLMESCGQYHSGNYRSVGVCEMIFDIIR
ncbi:hypothetical protein LINGRAHAP2_LOCUS12352 [Linum grandiflorum]